MTFLTTHPPASPMVDTLSCQGLDHTMFFSVNVKLLELLLFSVNLVRVFRHTNDRFGTAEPKAGDKKSGKCATFGGREGGL